MTSFTHKKSLGQNFLHDTTVIDDIIAHAQIAPTDNIVEIGPGEGALTQALAQRAQQVFAIEIDARLIPVLQKKCATYENVTIIHDDILHMHVPTFIADNIGDAPYRVVANIPYYITAPIIRLLLELPHPPRDIFLMVQKEVAERLTAQPGAMSILSVTAQYYADVSYLFTVDRHSFDPVPDVDSAVVRFVCKNRRDSRDDIATLFRTVKIGFSARRKTLANNLANGCEKTKEEIATLLTDCGLDHRVRAQELTLEQWQHLARVLYEK